jgi:hypothetical protein
MGRAGSTPAVTKACSAGRAESTCSEYSPDAVELARRVVAGLGGRYAAELDIHVGASDVEVGRWFLAAALFGAPNSARVAERAFGVLATAGLDADARFGCASLISGLPGPQVTAVHLPQGEGLVCLYTFSGSRPAWDQRPS